MVAVWPACLVTGLCFGVTQFLVSNFHGPWLVDIISAVVSMGALMVLMQFWKPANEQSTVPASKILSAADPIAADGPRWKAWLPWIFLSVFVFVWGLPRVKDALNALFAPGIPVPLLHHEVLRVPPVVLKPTPDDAIFSFNVFSATGTALLCSGILGGLCLGLRPSTIVDIYIRTMARVRISLLTIAIMLALGFTTRFSGTDTTIGLALAATGFLFPFFSPLIGWLGVALTGSDTSSNVLFGNLQQVTAQQLMLSPILTTAANSSGGVMGKMIDAQSIVVAGVATDQRGGEGKILRKVFFHSIALAILVGILALAQAYLLKKWVP